MKKDVKIINDSGLHARPASIFVKKANEFESQIFVKLGEKTINAKSIISLIKLGIKNESIITVIADGKDEKQALDALVQLIDKEINARDLF